MKPTMMHLPKDPNSAIDFTLFAAHGFRICELVSPTGQRGHVKGGMVYICLSPAMHERATEMEPPVEVHDKGGPGALTKGACSAPSRPSSREPIVWDG